MSYTPTPPELIALGAEALNDHWKQWESETDDSVEHEHSDCHHGYWPSQENVAREVIRALIESGHVVEFSWEVANLRRRTQALADAAGRLLNDGSEASPEVLTELRERLRAAEDGVRDALAGEGTA